MIITNKKLRLAAVFFMISKKRRTGRIPNADLKDQNSTLSPTVLWSCDLSSADGLSVLFAIDI